MFLRDMMIWLKSSKKIIETFPFDGTAPFHSEHIWPSISYNIIGKRKGFAVTKTQHFNASDCNSSNEFWGILTPKEEPKAQLSVLREDRRKHEKMELTSWAQITCSIGFISKTQQKHKENVIRKLLSPERQRAESGRDVILGIVSKSGIP